jgi:hypothetical protein
MACPWLECTQCANRIIVPEPYHKKGKYLCPPCDNVNTKVVTIVNVDTTPNVLNKENGISWLGLKENDGVLLGKSAFKLLAVYGTSVFDYAPPQRRQWLTLDYKKVHHPEEVRAQVERWVGREEVELGSCTLCFDGMPKNKLLPACGRKGCTQMADTDCLREWASLRVFPERFMLTHIVQLVISMARISLGGF